MVVVLRRRRWRPLPGDQHLGWHRGRRVFPLAPSGGTSEADDTRRSIARDGGRRVRRRRKAPSRSGRRARVHETLAGHDPRPLQGPRAVHRDVLEPVAERLGARRLGLDRRGRRVVPARAQRRHDQAGRQAARAGRGGVRPGVAPRGRGGSRRRHTRRGEGRGAVGLRGAGRRHRGVGRAAGRAGRPGRRAAGQVVPAVGHPFPKTRNAKVLRRAVRAAVVGADPGDLSSIEDPSTVDAVRAAR